MSKEIQLPTTAAGPWLIAFALIPAAQQDERSSTEGSVQVAASMLDVVKFARGIPSTRW